MNITFRCTVLATALALAACGANEPAEPARPAPANPTADAAAAAAAVDAALQKAPADEFLAAIARHCGEAFEGRIVANEPAPAADAPPDPFEGKTLVMHVRGCNDREKELRIPFHVGDDHSRTWILTRTDDGLRLKHDHRLPDGSDDPVTMYGGDTATPGTAERQEFPVDAESIEMFEREGLAASVTNVWAMEIHPGQRFVYELSRPGGRKFQVEFDLTKTVAAPPTPWGY
ncbi:hypothetical protein LDO26_02495 [Luteimonas sp. BDR2-5]|uniref:hypothetical protein n=1 Tax=Proluteimonas luteida TaxID=2878685 RepID=UPI001E5C9B41|nr:hypothetical protein [Luteimonas sp. BDR2-5]MCD9027083.1 hypothetical protein [Luteimonas sp. BDR2-5]